MRSEHLHLTIPEPYKKRLKEYIENQEIPSISEWIRMVIDKEIPKKE